MPDRELSRLLATLVVLACCAGGLTAAVWTAQLSPAQWLAASFHPDLDSPDQLAFHFSVLPRVCSALLAGAGLGLAGALLQQVLRNPLASPTTLGIDAGAQLTLTVAVIFAPSLLTGGRIGICLAGGLAALGMVLLCAKGSRFSSLALVLAGMVVSLFCGALAVALRLLNQEYVSVFFLWGGGALNQQDWSVPQFLTPCLVVLGAAALLAARPLELLSLEDEGARALGLPLAWIRAGGLLLAAVLVSVVTANVGVIGFVGLAAPQIARLSGARRLVSRLLASAGIGGLLLLTVDDAVGLLEARGVTSLPAGAATALLGAPLLLWLLPRLRRDGLPASPPRPRAVADISVLRLGMSAALALTIAMAASLAVGRIGGSWLGEGWHIAGLHDLGAVMPWRLPRMLVAAFSGAMLAAAGVILQRLTGNPLAAPEVLGIGTGVTFGLVVAMLLLPAARPLSQTLAGAAGGFAVLLLVLAAGRRSDFAPDHTLLAGIALSALLDAVVVAFLALGDPRATLLLSWISGSTYHADWITVAMTIAFAVGLLPAAMLLVRWLEILPLTDATGRSLGLPLGRARLAGMGVASLLTAGAVMATGPLTFVGLAGPHLARSLGARRSIAQVAVAALLGALIMVVADGLGRTLIAPRQLPAGLMAALIGLPYLVWQLARRHA